MCTIFFLTTTIIGIIIHSNHGTEEAQLSLYDLQLAICHALTGTEGRRFRNVKYADGVSNAFVSLDVL